ncbi:hypothetical protein N8I77_010519 [Diaporthe amygdali]|uniref:Protein IVY1 n=1 Tax=Phomopsis amygdali TaxID=1214568 RepID=A0AAD9S774_PHOAM|nr:phospholipid-binding protein [Diaporthe amygdali]KAJ0123497.1 phospholipid-binding protein [Diaporthe amygdali]KAK2601039.1 hypothetical protein N8I77_010519 [Diaporthe amygdali]
MTTVQQQHVANRPPSPSPSQLPPVPASPTYSYASTANPPSAAMNISSFNLPLPPPPPAQQAVLTKADLAASQRSYADLLSTAKAYRLALAALSNAASSFGSALESCARLKEATSDSVLLGNAPTASVTSSGGCTADSLLAAAGVHHLIANHEHILSETVYRSFEVPLLHELDKWRRDVEDEEASYLAAVKRQSQEIRRLEKEGMKLHRQRGPRDVSKFRGHLVELTTKLDGLTCLHGEHSRTLLRESQDTSVKILESSCSLVRAEVDIFESLARKGWSGGGLDELLEKGTDLFAAEPAPADADADASKLFSILPPKSILADTASESGMGLTRAMVGNVGGRKGHERADSLGVVSDPYQSLAGAVSSPEFRAVPDTDNISIFSADFASNGRPRMTRPFSPQPVRVNPEDVMGGTASDDQFHGEGAGSAVTSDDDGPPSPATIRNGGRSASADGFRMPSHSDLSLSINGDEDEHPWGSKRISSAASDPDERERRWNAADNGME